MKKFLLLGYGYTAKAIEQAIKFQNPKAEIFGTSRSGVPHIRFDLKDRKTWEKLPSVDGTFWTFPAEDEATVKTFLEHYEHRLGKVVVIGSTSAFTTTMDHEEVDEATPLNESLERVLGENLIRQSKGVAVYSAGIYGPSRNPVDWVRKGWVAPSPKYLNVIHVKDLANICYGAMLRGKPGGIYIAADSRPHTWDDLIERWVAQYDITVSNTGSGSQRKSKKLSSLKTLQELDIQLEYPDIFIGVSELESPRR